MYAFMGEGFFNDVCIYGGRGFPTARLRDAIFFTYSLDVRPNPFEYMTEISLGNFLNDAVVMRHVFLKLRWETPPTQRAYAYFI